MACYNIKKYAFYPPSIFMWLTFLTQQTVIISLNSMDQLVSLMETEYVTSEMGTEFWTSKGNSGIY
jgi:hypothetical protein